MHTSHLVAAYLRCLRLRTRHETARIREHSIRSRLHARRETARIRMPCFSRSLHARRQPAHISRKTCVSAYASVPAEAVDLFVDTTGVPSTS